MNIELGTHERLLLVKCIDDYLMKEAKSPSNPNERRLAEKLRTILVEWTR